MSERLPDTVLYDKRLIARHIAKGLITREDVEKRLKETEDLTYQADITPLDEIMGIVERGDSDESAAG